MVRKVKLMKFTAYIPIIVLFSAVYSQANDAVDKRLTNLHSCLLSVDKYVSENKWVRINTTKIVSLQKEICENSDTIVKGENFYKYLPLMTKETIRIVRNTFFALKGYRFKDNDLLKHFNRFAWYKPSPSNNCILTKEENKRIRLLKVIEEKWLYGRDEATLSQSLPKTTLILNDTDKKTLKIGSKEIDISSVVHGSGYSESFFDVHGAKGWDSTILCSQFRFGDSIMLKKVELFSSNGELTKSFTNEGEYRINGFDECPNWFYQRPKILISYNKGGCCGAMWDTLITLNTDLAPVTFLNCSEGSCGGSDLFIEPNEEDIYLIVFATGHSINDSLKGNVRYISYTYGSCNQKYFNNWISIYLIEHNGNIKLIAVQVEKFHYEPPCGSPNKLVVDTPYSIVNLHDPDDKDSLNHIGKVTSSLRVNDKLLLFSVLRGTRNQYDYIVTVIPIGSNV